MSVTISKLEYFNLKFASETLNLLMREGVDVYEWHNEFLYPEGEDSIEDIKENLRNEIIGK